MHYRGNKLDQVSKAKLKESSLMAPDPPMTLLIQDAKSVLVDKTWLDPVQDALEARHGH